MNPIKQVFDDEESCRKHLEHALLGTDVSSQLDGFLLGAIVAACQETPVPKPESGMSLILKRWVIRDGDLDLFSAVRHAYLGLAPGFALGSLTGGAVGGVVFSLLALLRRAHRHGATLRHADIALLTVLRAAGRPISASTVAKSLLGGTSGAWGVDRVEEGLRRLSEVPTRTGLVRFAQMDGQGRWMACDI